MTITSSCDICRILSRHRRMPEGGGHRIFSVSDRIFSECTVMLWQVANMRLSMSCTTSIGPRHHGGAVLSTEGGSTSEPVATHRADPNKLRGSHTTSCSRRQSDDDANRFPDTKLCFPVRIKQRVLPMCQGSHRRARGATRICPVGGRNTQPGGPTQPALQTTARGWVTLARAHERSRFYAAVEGQQRVCYAADELDDYEMTEPSIAPSIGSRGDSDDTAIAEAVNAVYGTELIHRAVAVRRDSWSAAPPRVRSGVAGTTVREQKPLS
jgi:hypothetical protein